ncbi:MAG: hypothetical protein J3K34DRAFT_256674 [Monoraphidium minutum]|nr:MAG: hypothetical protein J3K34DRAFT_256674 [Monoraphidium minutum]
MAAPAPGGGGELRVEVPPPPLETALSITSIVSGAHSGELQAAASMQQRVAAGERNGAPGRPGQAPALEHLLAGQHPLGQLQQRQWPRTTKDRRQQPGGPEGLFQRRRQRQPQALQQVLLLPPSEQQQQQPQQQRRRRHQEQQEHEQQQPRLLHFGGMAPQPHDGKRRQASRPAAAAAAAAVAASGGDGRAQQRDACPLCNQCLLPPQPHFGGTCLSGLSASTRSGQHQQQQLRPSPVKAPRSGRSAGGGGGAPTRWHTAAGQEAAPQGPLRMVRSGSVDAALAELAGGGGAARGSRAVGEGPSSAPSSPRPGRGAPGAAAPPLLPLGGAARDLALAAAELAVGGGGRGGQGGSFSCCTLVMTFTDPGLPVALARLVKGDMRLLKHYESGLPAWAVVLPSYGLFYRPWMRRITWLLFVLVSVVSMALGFYDLYKNVPHFKSLVTRAFMPASYLFEWLELHTQMRLSILLTYLLGKSPLLVQALRLARSAAAVATEALQPVWAAAVEAGSGVAWALRPVGAALSALALALQQLAAALLWGPLQLLGWLRDAALPLLSPLASAFGTVAATMRWGGGVARGVAGAAPAVASGAGAAQHNGWLLLSSWARLEALHLQQALVLRAVRSAQAIVRFWLAAATTLNQHRVSLLLQLRQQLQGLQHRAAATRVGAGVTAVARPLLEARRRRQQLRTVASGPVTSDSSLVPPPAPAAPGAPHGGEGAGAAAHLGVDEAGYGASTADAASEADSSPLVQPAEDAASAGEGSSIDGEGGRACSSSSSVGSPDATSARRRHGGGAGTPRPPGTLGPEPPAAVLPLAPVPTPQWSSPLQPPAQARQQGRPQQPSQQQQQQQQQQPAPPSSPPSQQQPAPPPSQPSPPQQQQQQRHWRGPRAAPRWHGRVEPAGPQGHDVQRVEASAAAPPSRGPSVSSANSASSTHASGGSAFLAALREAAGGQQQQQQLRRRWSKHKPLPVPAGLHAAPPASLAAPRPGASDDGTAAVSAWERAAAGLRGVKWLRSVKSHPV